MSASSKYDVSLSRASLPSTRLTHSSNIYARLRDLSRLLVWQIESFAMTSNNTHGAAGPPKITKDAILETGAAATQSFNPIKAICAHLNAFHVYASDPSRSVEANHYCTHLSADV